MNKTTRIAMQILKAYSKFDISNLEIGDLVVIDDGNEYDNFTGTVSSIGNGYVELKFLTCADSELAKFLKGTRNKVRTKQFERALIFVKRNGKVIWEKR